MKDRLPDKLVPEPKELAGLLGEEKITDRDRQLLLKWEHKVRGALLNKAKSPTATPHRWHMASERPSATHKFEIPRDEGEPFKGYLIIGFYKDGQPGEVFLETAKEGSFVSGILDALASMISIGLQHGIPLEIFIKKFKHTKFEPAGIVQGAPKEIKGFSDSILDYVAKYLELIMKRKKDKLKS